MKKYFIFFIFLFFCIQIKAQNNRVHGINNNFWFQYNGDHKIAKKWGIHIEAFVRRNDFIKNPQQFLFRTGINYHINNSVFFTLGHAYVKTSAYGVFPSKAAFPEQRVWQQMQVKVPLSKVEWVCRFRLEQRFVKPIVYNAATANYQLGNSVYTNRFRIFNRYSLPLKGSKIIDKSFYGTIFNELFINFGKNVANNIFDQNRIFAGIGYKIPVVGRLEFGYLNQTIVKSDGLKIEHNRTFQIALNASMDFFKK